VSVATVSRVLNGAKNVSLQTRSRVEQAIDALGFVPNSAARAINSGRTRLVGALIPTLDHAIFARFIAAVEERLDRHGLSLVVATTHYDLECEVDRARKLLDIGAEGLIVSGITRADAFYKLVARYKVPVISTSYFKPDEVFPTIGYDNIRVAELALQHLLSLGHVEIAVLSGPVQSNDRTRARLAGLQNLPAARLSYFESEQSFASVAQAVMRARQEAPQASAYLCLTDVLAQGALLRLKSEGIAVPKEISVIGIDDLPNSASYDPPLTTVHLPVGRMGARTAEAIAAWIETSEAPPSENLETRLIKRGTVARLS